MFPSNSFSSSQQRVQRLNSRILCFHLYNLARVNSNCYQDNSKRILQSPHRIMKESSMTIEKFEKFCFEKNNLCEYVEVLDVLCLFYLQKVHKEQLIHKGSNLEMEKKCLWCSSWYWKCGFIMRAERSREQRNHKSREIMRVEMSWELRSQLS